MYRRDEKKIARKIRITYMREGSEGGVDGLKCKRFLLLFFAQQQALTVIYNL